MFALVSVITIPLPVPCRVRLRMMMLADLFMRILVEAGEVPMMNTSSGFPVEDWMVRVEFGSITFMKFSRSMSSSYDPLGMEMTTLPLVPQVRIMSRTSLMDLYTCWPGRPSPSLLMVKVPVGMLAQPYTAFITMVSTVVLEAPLGALIMATMVSYCPAVGR